MSEEQKSLCEAANFSLIFNEYADNLYRYLLYKCGNQALAQDLTQEAFTKLWKNCATVIYHTAKSYVFTIANNLLLNDHKHQKVVLKFQHQSQRTHSYESPEFLLEEKELQEQLEAAIAKLPEKQRVVFLLSRIDKKKYQEIADMLGISKKAVEKRMYLALTSLRKVVNVK